MSERKTGRAVIMAGAHISDYSFYKPLEGDFVICADRGYLHAEKLGIVPAVVLGDLDSLDTVPPADIQKIVFPREKDETDLQLAIDFAISRGYRSIYTIGAFGGRVDHFLGNIGLMKWAKERGVDMILEEEGTCMRLLQCPKACLLVRRRENFYLSVIPFFADAVVSLSGVKYPAEKVHIPVGDTRGISNEITENFASVTLHSGSALILECRADRNL